MQKEKKKQSETGERFLTTKPRAVRHADTAIFLGRHEAYLLEEIVQRCAKGYSVSCANSNNCLFLTININYFNNKNIIRIIITIIIITLIIVKSLYIYQWR